MRFWFSKIAEGILDRPRLVLVLLALVTAVMAPLAFRVEFDYTIEHLFPQGDPDVVRYFQFRDEFEREDNLILLIYDCQDPFLPSNLRTSRTLIGQLEAIEGVDKVTGLANVELFTEGGDYLLQPLFGKIPSDPDSIARAKLHALNSPLLRNTLISADGQLAALALEISDRYNTHDHRQRILAQVDRIQSQVDWQWHQVGIPVLRTRYIEYMLADYFPFISLVTLLVLIILAGLFRSWIGLLLPIVTVTVALIWTMGLMRILGISINIVTYLTPTLLYIVGIGDSIHVLVKYYGELVSIRDQRRALHRTMLRIGTSIFLTSLTTAIGFLALTTANILIIRQFGLIVAIGVILAYLVSVTLLPAVLVLLPPPRPELLRKYHTGIRTRLVGHIIHINENYPIPVSLAMLGLIGICLMGVLRLSSDATLMDDLRPGNTLYDDMHLVEQRLGSILPLEVILTIHSGAGEDSSSPLDALDPVILAEVAELQAFLRGLPPVGMVISVVDYLKDIHRSMHSGDSVYWKLPGDRQTIAQYYLLFESEFEHLVNLDYTRLRLSGRMHDVPPSVARTLTARIQEWFRKHGSGRLELTVTGTTLMALKTQGYLVRNLSVSFLVAFVLIFIIMVILFRSWNIALIAVIPNLIPLLIMAAVMGYFNIKLRPTTAMTFAIAFGIAIDDTIHYLTRFRMELPEHDWHYRLANTATLHSAGVAILTTTLILVCGFLVLTVSNFAPVREFGLLSAVTLTSAVFGDLLLLASLILVLRPVFKKKY